MATYKHFGVNLIMKNGGLKLTRDNYAIINKKCTTLSDPENHFERLYGEEKIDKFLEIYEDTSAKYYTDSFCEKHKKDALKNFDLNITYISLLDKSDFKQSIILFLNKYVEFTEIKDLNSVANKPGYYLMILDEYCQTYIGTSNNIKKRIMQHWSKQKQFDRLIWGSVENSKLSIDSFRALDTTRIYAYHTNNLYSNEDGFINDIPEKYNCNRMRGGIPVFGSISILATMKTRKL